MWNLRIWQAVLVDLWQFLWGVRSSPVLELPPDSNQIAPPPITLLQSLQVMPVRAQSDVTAPVFVHATPDECYVLAITAVVSITPYQGFDTTLTTVQFGEAVTVRAYQGSYAQIMTAAGPGWIHKDALAASRGQVWPNLLADTIYAADSAATQLIRRHLNDVFNADLMCLPLQSVEYISYRLKQIKRVVNWGAARPRLPGVWQDQLKGRSGIHIGVQPLADSIMEYRNEAGDGVLCYVEAVAPDNTLTCSTVGLNEAGRYTSHVFTTDQWREWRPVFIDVMS